MTDDPLFIADEELPRRLGCPRNVVRDALAMFDRDPRSGFPKKEPLWGGRRYWPAVRHYFDRLNGLIDNKKTMRAE
jgi:hypothetical protein